MHTLLHDMLDWRARRTPEAIAVRTSTVAWTYDELRRRSQAYAEFFRRAGLTRGDRILINAPHAPETVAVVYAAARAGCLYVVVSDQMPAQRLRQIVADCEPRIMLTTIAGLAVARTAGAPSVAVLDDLPAEPTGDPASPPALSVDLVGLIYTSGSTSTPKAVVSTHAQVLFAARAVQSRLGYRPDDVVFCCLPLSFDYGLYQVFLSCLGGGTLLLAGPEAAGPPLLGHLLRHRVTVFPLMPPLATVLAALIARSGEAPPALRLITSSGATLAPQLAEQLRTRIPGMALVCMFGLTECKRVAVMEPDGDIRRPGAVGRPLPDTEILIVDAEGRTLPPGEAGELVVRGPHVMSGYWRAPELTAAKFRRDEFGAPLLFTGDICRVDADGYLYFVGRRDDVYKHRGFRVSGAEVEAATMGIPDVRTAVLFPPAGEADALLVVSGDTTPTDVLKHLASRLEDYKVPRECRVLPSMPLNPNGKVDRRRLAVLVGRSIEGAVR